MYSKCNKYAINKAIKIIFGQEEENYWNSGFIYFLFTKKVTSTNMLHFHSPVTFPFHSCKMRQSAKSEHRYKCIMKVRRKIQAWNKQDEN